MECVDQQQICLSEHDVDVSDPMESSSFVEKKDHRDDFGTDGDNDDATQTQPQPQQQPRLPQTQPATLAFSIHTIRDLDHLKSFMLLDHQKTGKEHESSNNQNHLLVALLYKADCPFSLQVLKTFQQLVEKLKHQEPTIYTGPLLFATIRLNPSTQAIVDRLQVTSVPALYIFKQQQDQLWAVEYTGRTDTIESFEAGLRHFVSRLFRSILQYKQRKLSSTTNALNINYTSSSSSSSTAAKLEYLEAMTVYAESTSQLEEMLSNDNPPIFPTPNEPVILPLDPHLSFHEKEWIQYIMTMTTDDEDHRSTKNWVFCRCQEATTQIAQEFDPLAAVLNIRHDVLFCVLKNCPTVMDEDSVVVFQVGQTDNKINTDKTIENSAKRLDFVQLLNPKTDVMTLEQSMATLLRPTLLWWDRQATTPIAFAPYHHTHAALIIDFHTFLQQQQQQQQQEGSHHNDNTQASLAYKQKIRHLVQEFHNVCNEKKSSLVCIVIPSTETRVLTTFGIDIWSAFDDPDWESSNGGTDPASTFHPPAISDILPVLLLTNQTIDGGVERYYLDPPFFHINATAKMEAFFTDFFRGRLNPELKSSFQWKKSNCIASDRGDSCNNGNNDNDKRENDSPEPIKLPPAKQNSHFVSEWTSYHVRVVRQREQDNRKLISQDNSIPHTLLMIYAPTCGHCKRLNIVWNELGRLVRHLQWNKWLQIARLDVTREEMTGVPGASLLPSVYYYYHYPHDSLLREQTKDSERLLNPVWFNRTEAGAVSDPLVFLDWLLDVGHEIDANSLLDEMATTV